MDEQQGVVTEGYTAQYPDPIEFEAGEGVTVGRRDAEWPGWVWCTSRAGKSGWVPEEFLEIEGDEGRARRAYHARELTVRPGERVRLGEAAAGWVWVTNAAGQSGWVPEQVVAQEGG